MLIITIFIIMLILLMMILLLLLLLMVEVRKMANILLAFCLFLLGRHLINLILDNHVGVTLRRTVDVFKTELWIEMVLLRRLILLLWATVHVLFKCREEVVHEDSSMLILNLLERLFIDLLLQLLLGWLHLSRRCELLLLCNVNLESASHVTAVGCFWRFQRSELRRHLGRLRSQLLARARSRLRSFLLLLLLLHVHKLLLLMQKLFKLLLTQLVKVLFAKIRNL